MNNKQVLDACNNSPFRKNYASYTYHVKRLFSYESGGITLFTDYEHQAKGQNMVEHCTPEFQRANNKWSLEQKTKFVENTLRHYRSEIMLYRVGDLEDAMILDGLQRMTALHDFYVGLVKPFGKTFDEILKINKGMFSASVQLRIYDFDTLADVGKFYIEMNEGITHSPEDIQKCKDWFLTKGITL